ncbi:MAG TPA: MFS transporter [Syntrophales bacterium]|mgnify:CR=1 FL=1|nr:MFS transporter [Syntrophales bacterium]HOX94157.1 MFS transporter [Syntrophales bacterium]HPI56296.1 MFS transporter [Syntrophales bacterium]HPN24483.1 MFS transporter [Syntrophales bacterium]HQM29113.1 MFS transporter [Syntrophales bacterium]
MVKSETRFVFFICLAEILSMTGTMYFPALLPSFQKEWGISNTGAGWISGVFFAGYAVAAPFFVSLTDRVDTRRIYLPCAFLAGLSIFLFGWLADGLWSAAVIRLLAGIGLAGSYMPGLKALSDNVTGPKQSRYIAFYTATYAVGTALSVYFAGFLEPLLGWRRGAELLAVGPLAAVLIFSILVPPREPLGSKAALHFSRNDLKVVLGNRPAMGYILGYGAHCWELCGYRSWIVAFLVFSLSFHPGLVFPLSPQSVAMIIFFIGVPATILGNEGAMRWGRQRTLTIYMVGSGILGCIIGFSASLDFHLVVVLSFLYGITVLLDSGALTAGLVSVSPPAYQGMTLAVYTFIGFGIAFLSPLAFGAVLDFAGNGIMAWGLAFSTMGLGCLSGVLWLRIFRAP